MRLLYALLLITCIIVVCVGDSKSKKKATQIKETKQNPKHSNPNFIRDRNKTEIVKPQLPDSYTQRFRKPFNSAWMDWCDPYHCNDYHKIACGLNRKTMRFKWFQSICHVILNNQCATYRGSLKYDLVDTKFCSIYVMYLRTGCPTSCNREVQPVCAVSAKNNNVVLFQSKCALDLVNCRNQFNQFEEVKLSLCDFYVHFDY